MRVFRMLSAAGIALGLLGCGGAPPPAKRAQPTAAPEFEAHRVDGTSFRFSESAGKVRLVNFWATWCAPCREEIPTFKDLEAAYGPKGFQLVGIAMDDEGAEVVAPFLKENDIGYLNVIGNDAIVEKFGGVLGLPTSILVDRDGRIVKRWPPGMVPKSVLEREISPLVAS